MIVMKKNYQIPTTEIIPFDTEVVMVPNEMSDPTFVGANSYSFEDEESEENGYFELDKPENKLWN